MDPSTSTQFWQINSRWDTVMDPSFSHLVDLPDRRSTLARTQASDAHRILSCWEFLEKTKKKTRHLPIHVDGLWKTVIYISTPLFLRSIRRFLCKYQVCCRNSNSFWLFLSSRRFRADFLGEMSGSSRMLITSFERNRRVAIWSISSASCA